MCPYRIKELLKLEELIKEANNNSFIEITKLGISIYIFLKFDILGLKIFK